MKIKFQETNWQATKPRHKNPPNKREQSLLNNESKNSNGKKLSSSCNNYCNSSEEGWSLAHVQFYQAKERKKWICIDPNLVATK
jgi:hypothetical protein